ncbi:MAG: DUF3617 domain-containing protein [Sphingomonadaceae bacterium]
MKRVGLSATLLLAACNSGPNVTAQNASTAEVAAKVAEAQAAGQFIAPGRWEATMTINEVSIPNMPPAMAEKMKGAMGEPQTSVSCLTAEDVKQPKEGFFGGESSKSCRYESFTMAGGKIASVMKCAGEGMSRTMTMDGTYSADRYQMTVASTGTAAANNPMGAMRMKMSMDAKRTGACTGKEDQEGMGR